MASEKRGSATPPGATPLPLEVAIDKVSAADEEITFSSPEEQRKRLQNESLTQDIEQRKTYAGRTFWITSSWVAFMIVVTISQQVLSIWDYGLHRSEFIAVMTSSTFTVLGMWGIVGAYLFWRPRAQGPDSQD